MLTVAQKSNSYLYRNRLSLSIVVVCGLLMVVTITSSLMGMAAAITNGYATTDSQLKTGMAVVISDQSSGDHPVVERANPTSNHKVLGVTVDPRSALVATASANSQVYVATSGEAPVYTVDINGAVKKGDNLTLSPIRGIVMRADSSTSEIVGQALEDFPQTTETVNYTTANLATATARLAQVKIAVNPQTVAVGVVQNGTVLKQLGKQLVHKDTSELQVIAAMVIFSTVLIGEGVTIYSAVSNAIIALGRNPLSRAIIYTTLFRMFGVAVVVLLIGLGATYLVLWI